MYPAPMAALTADTLSKSSEGPLTGKVIAVGVVVVVVVVEVVVGAKQTETTGSVKSDKPVIIFKSIESQITELVEKIPVKL